MRRRTCAGDPQSRSVVTPLANARPALRRIVARISLSAASLANAMDASAASSGWSARWQCESIRPGATVHPLKSSTSSAASDRRAPRGPIATMRSASIVTAMSSSGAPPEPSKSRSARSVKRRGRSAAMPLSGVAGRRDPGRGAPRRSIPQSKSEENVFSCDEHRTRPTSARLPSSEFPDEESGATDSPPRAERRALTRSSTRD